MRKFLVLDFYQIQKKKFQFIRVIGSLKITDLRQKKNDQQRFTGILVLNKLTIKFTYISPLKAMKNSNLFSDYMVASSVNRSIREMNHSPTSGVIHKKNSSYGPRLTLINQSGSQSPAKRQKQSNGTELQTQEYIEKILLLTLQISRLNNLNESLRKESSVNSHGVNEMNSSKIYQSSKELTLVKQTNENLKIAIKTLQSSLMKGEEQKSRLKSSYQQRISQLQVQVSNYQWKLQQAEKQLQKLRREKYEMQVEAQRIQIETRKGELQRSKAVQMQMARSIEKQKNYQISLLKDNVNRLQSQLAEFRYTMKEMKEKNEQLANREAQLLLLNRQYQSQFQQIKRRINYELKETSINTVLQLRDLAGYDNAIHRNEELERQMIEYQQNCREKEGQLREMRSINEELRQNNRDFREKCEQLSQHLNQNQFWEHKRTTQLQEALKLETRQKQLEIQQLNQEVQKLTLELDLLKKIIAEQKQTIDLKNIEHSTKNIELNDKLRQTERKLRRAEKSTAKKEPFNLNGENVYFLPNAFNNYQLPTSPETRLFKSRSIQSTSFFTAKRLPSTQLSLQSIVTTTVALQGSAQRSLRLIAKSQQKLISSCMSPVKHHKRKVFIEHNSSLNRDDSDTSGNEREKQRTRKYNYSSKKRRELEEKQRTSRKKRDDENMRSSIREYYGA